MIKLVVDRKTGFKVLDTSIPVVINDFRGIEFYDTSVLKNPVKEFNLPAGIYYVISGHFKEMLKPVKFPLNKLPWPERTLDFPSDFKIEFGDNPYTASIIWPEKRILFDSSMASRPLPELYFILYHEFAHHVYTTEKYVDRLAENFLLKKGFNPSQTASAPITSLSEKQVERKEDAVNRHLNRWQKK